MFKPLQSISGIRSRKRYDPYAPNKEDNKKSAQSSAAEPEGENAYASFQGLLALARITGSNADETRGSCKKCGRVGHLTFQCRNFLSIKEDKDKDPEAIQAAVISGLEKIKGHTKRSANESSDESDEEESESSDSDYDSEIEKAIAKKYGKGFSSKSNSSRNKRDADSDEDDSDSKDRKKRGRKRKSVKRRRKDESSDEDRERQSHSRKSRKEKRRRRSHCHSDDSDSDSSEDSIRRHKRKSKSKIKSKRAALSSDDQMPVGAEDSQIPIKVNVLAWKISMDRLPTRVNLHRRGVQVSPISCPICCEALENLDHLLFCCDLAKDIARFNQVQNKCWKECFTLPGGVSGHIETISSSLIQIFEKMVFLKT
ncbi:CAX-interacting protein 4 [Tanacetum coccineum]